MGKEKYEAHIRETLAKNPPKEEDALPAKEKFKLYISGISKKDKNIASLQELIKAA